MNGIFSRARVVMTALTLVSLLFASESAPAQNFNGDARLIALGGVGENKDDAAKLAGNPLSYRSFVIPLGLFQVLKNTNIYDPSSSQFDPLQAMELLASPLHYTFNRTEGAGGEALVKDVVAGDINRDLNTYRGFIPQASLVRKGLISPTWGMTLPVKGNKGGPFQGVYFGVGPYLSVGTDVEIDPKLIAILASSTNVYVPNSSFLIHNVTEGQAAASITGGYRARFGGSGQSTKGISGSKRDGIYVAANYNYLYGLHYDNANLNVQFDTDSTGLITLAPTTIPVIATHEYATKGRGYSIDLSADVVKGHWDVRAAANGLANRIDWQTLQSRQYSIGSLLQSLSFTTTTEPSPAATRRIVLPVRYLTGVGYNADHWTVQGEIGHGLNGLDFRTGAEYRFKVLDIRGGAKYSEQMWEPAGGVGLNFGKHFGLDVAAFGTATNIERQRKATLAASIRYGH